MTDELEKIINAHISLDGKAIENVQYKIFMVLTYPQLTYFLDNYEVIKNLEELDLTHDQILQIRQIVHESPSRQDAKDLIIRTKIQGILDKFS